MSVLAIRLGLCRGFDNNNNVLAIISLVLGIMAIVGQICNCVPLVNYAAMVLLPMLGIAAIITGGIGISKANTMDGEGKPLAMAGVGLGCASLLVTATFVALIIFGVAAVVAANA